MHKTVDNLQVCMILLSTNFYVQDFLKIAFNEPFK